MIKSQIILLNLLLWFGLNVTAQDKINTIERAMEDEMGRSMAELKSDQYADPFFIRYRIYDQRNINIVASMGAIQHSFDLPNRTKDVRVMVGDYEFNDESLDASDGGNGPQPFGYSDFSMPLGEDYYGIRRSLWITTDAIYKVAGEIYKQKVRNLEEDGKTYEDIEHRKFAKVSAVEHIEPIKSLPFDKIELEDFARKLSSLFLKEEKLANSSVSITTGVTTTYFLNSEGTKSRTSEQFTSIIFSASMFSKKETLNFETYSLDIYDGGKLPTLEQAGEIVAKLVANIKSKSDLEKFEDRYYGPVLFSGKIVSQLLNGYLVNQLYTSVVLNNDDDFYSYETSHSSFDDRIGKRVVDKNMSVTLHTSLDEWMGNPLPGSYKIDAEGVISPDTLILIENGILRDLMTTRTVIREGQKPNGTGSGPGVVLISSKETLSEKDMKQKLMDFAKENEQDYAIIIRESPSHNGNNNFDAYKVDLETGMEQQIANVNFSDFNLNSLKRIAGISTISQVSHIQGVSYIAPEAILIEDINVSSAYQQIKMKKPVVESPLNSNN